MADKYRDQGLVVLAVNAWNEPQAVLKRFVKENKLKHHILLNGEAVFRESYGLQGVPYTFWIDRQGKVFYVESGLESQRKLQERTTSLLAVDG